MGTMMESVCKILGRWASIHAALRSRTIQCDDLVWLENAVGTFAFRCWIQRQQEALDAGLLDTLGSIATDRRLPPLRETLWNRIRQQGFQGALNGQSSGEQLALLSILTDPQALLELEDWATSPDSAGSAWPDVLDRSGGGVTPLCLDLENRTEVKLQNAWRTGDQSCPRIEQKPSGRCLQVSAWFPRAMMDRRFEALLTCWEADYIRSLEEQANQTGVRLSCLMAENWATVLQNSEAKTSQPQSVEAPEVQFELPVGQGPHPLIGKLLLVGVI